MTATVFTVKKDSRQDRLYFKFTPVVNLTGLSLLFSMVNRTTSVVKIDKVAAVIAVGAHTIDGVAYTLTAADGWGYYDWPGTADLDTVGNYGGEVWIVYPGPKYSKWPSNELISITVYEDAPI